MTQETSGRPCGWRVLLEGDKTMMTIVCLDDINRIGGVTGKKGVHVLYGGYCSNFQVEHTSTWKHNTLCTTGTAESETSYIIASGRQHGRHKITT